MLIIYIQLLFFISAAQQQEIELILRKLSDTLIPFYKNETDDIFEQLDKKINFEGLNISYQHECFSDYNYLGSLLEITDPQLQFLALVSGCVIQHDFGFDGLQSGFIQLQQNESEYKNGYFIKSVDDGIVLMAFRTFFHSSFIFHQCKFDGFTNQCIKGNNDHVLKLGASCNSYYKNVFCQDEDPYSLWLLWQQVKVAYYPGWFIFFYYYCSKSQALKEDTQKRVSLILAAIIFLVVTNWEFVMIISIWKFAHYHLLTNKFNFVEKFILYGTFFQIYANLIIGSENFYVSKESAETLIFAYIAMLILQIFAVIFSTRVSIVVLLYFVNYYVNYLKAMIELNTLVDNEFKFGMIYLNLVIGNLKELNAPTLIKFKHQILQILLEMEINWFPYMLSLFLLFVALHSGHKQLQKKGKRSILKYIVECFCQMQLSLLYLPLTVLSTIFNQQHTLVSCENFYLFWIYFFYFPSDFPFVSLLLSFALLFFNNGETFMNIYQELVKMSKMIKLEDITKSNLKKDFSLLLY